MSDMESKIRNAQAVDDSSPNVQDQSNGVRGNLPSALPINFSLRVLRAEAESHAISRALQQTGGNRKRAAQLLRISYRGLLYKMQRFNIIPDKVVASPAIAGGAASENR